MSSLFPRAFELLMRNEGGYSNDPSDNGGETKYGISKKQYPNLDIKNLTIQEAMEIYKRDYWDKHKCDEFPWPVAWPLFDCVVNHNASTAVKWLQKAVGSIQDGVIGPRTIASVNNVQALETIVRDIAMERILYYMQLEDWPVYKRGWTRRAITMVVEAITEG